MSNENKLLSEIVAYGKYSFELEQKREDSLISQANQMATMFSFSTAALYILFQIAAENFKELPKNLLVVMVGTITVILLFSLLFAFISSWRWKQGSMYNSDEF